MIGSPWDQDDGDRAAELRQSGDAGPLGHLPQLSHRQVQLESRLARLAGGGQLSSTALGLEELLGPISASSPAEVLWRPSGLHRPGLVAQISWPRLTTRFALGLETPLAHALVDRLLGELRPPAESRLQLTPVEWGVLTYLLARGLSRQAERSGSLGPWDLLLDRVGPDPFDVRHLGAIVTVRWGVRVGEVEGLVRLWLPESLVVRWLAAEPLLPFPPPFPRHDHRFAELAGTLRAEAGYIDLPRGIGTLRVGGVLPLGGSRLQGTPRSPTGPIELTTRLNGTHERLWFLTEPVAESGGLHLTLRSPLQRDPVFREGIAVNPPTDPTLDPSAASGGGGLPPTDIPVTLTVELGRVNLSLSRLADLKPGDVVELGRHSREPVELTSGGRLVARGELVLIDTELGVRVTNVFL